MDTLKKILTALLIVSALTIGAAGSAAAGALLADLENALMCKCDDKCGKVLINCTCSTADKTRAEFTKLLESGLTVEQIVQGQVAKYGETVLSAPTKGGFNLTAWMMPFAALVAGGLGIRKVMGAWIQKKGVESEGAPDSSKEEETPSVSAKYANRLKDELDQIEL